VERRWLWEVMRLGWEVGAIPAALAYGKEVNRAAII
jgi:hypothetical protein